MPLLRKVRDEMERAVISQTLYSVNGNISTAAVRLGITRPTLYMRLWHYWPRGNWPARRTSPRRVALRTAAHTARRTSA